MKITLAYYLRIDRSNHSGQNQVYLRFTKNRSPRLIGMGLWIYKKEWSGRELDYFNKSCRSVIVSDWNTYLTSRLNHAQSIVLSAAIKGINLEFETFKECFNNADFDGNFNGTHNINYVDFFEIYEQVKQSKIKKGIDKETIKNYTKEYNRIKKFSSEIDVREIDQEWLDQIQHFFRTEMRNGNNTIRRTLRHIKMVIKKSIQEKLITEDPFFEYSLPKVQTKKREFLTEEESNLFHELYLVNVLPPSYQNVLKQFLSACYLGFDFGCMISIKCTDIKRENGMYFLKRERAKNGITYVVPLTDKALQIIDIEKIIGKDGLLFRSISNKNTNDFLRGITQKLEIKNKRVTFHVGRHTFGTQSVNKGVPLEALQKMMGHSSIKQTQYYSRISNKFALNFYDKLNT